MRIDFKRTWGIVAISMFLLLPAFAQNNQKTLKIGEKIDGNIQLTFYNSKTKAVKISELKDKLIIFDFWGVFCSGCIESMPHMEELQKKYGDKIAIILVTKDSKEKVEALRKKSDIVRNTKLPMVVEDKVLSELLKHQGFPTHAYIDADGTYLALTNGTNTNEKQIQLILDKQKTTVPQAVYLENYNPQESFLTAGNGTNLQDLTSYSLFIRDYIGMMGFSSKQSTNTKKTYWYHNTAMTVTQCYYFAFQKILDSIGLTNFNENRLLVDKNRQSEFIRREFIKENDPADWLNKARFGYELKLDSNANLDYRDVMRNDLDHYFQVKSTVEVCKVKCLVLKRVDGVDVVKSKSKESKFLRNHNGYSFFLEKGKLKSLVYNLNFGDIPVLDETSFIDDIDLYIKSNLDTTVSLNLELKKFGFELIEDYREIPMVVIRDNRNSISAVNLQKLD